MARCFAALALLALACAGASPVSLQADVAGRSAIESALAGLELSFVDPETLEGHRTVGPYRVLAREPGRTQIEGVDPLSHVPRLVTLIENGDEIWAWSRIGPRDFLARIR